MYDEIVSPAKMFSTCSVPRFQARDTVRSVPNINLSLGSFHYLIPNIKRKRGSLSFSPEWNFLVNEASKRSTSSRGCSYFAINSRYNLKKNYTGMSLLSISWMDRECKTCSVRAHEQQHENFKLIK